jgi:uncharacterized damage-inducible protein DinB
MNIVTYFRAQAYNNAWCNHRLLSACAQLSDAELVAPRTSFFPSINHTLNHILTVDWYYVSALEGACMGASAWRPEIPCPAMVDLDREQRAVDQRLIALCEGYAEADLDATIELIRPHRIQIETAGRTLMHLLQHQIHHRGQVHAMLSGTRIAPPQLDEFFLDDGQERALRTADFAALGFHENLIWRP